MTSPRLTEYVRSFESHDQLPQDANKPFVSAMKAIADEYPDSTAPAWVDRANAQQHVRSVTPSSEGPVTPVF